MRRSVSRSIPPPAAQHYGHSRHRPSDHGSEMALTLCALLWARPGEERALIAYEDAVLQLVPVHGGHVVQRARTDGLGDAPLEIHLLQFPSEAALEAYM